MREPIRSGKLVVYIDRRLAEADRQPIALANKEYAMLEVLSLHKGSTVPTEMLVRHLYGSIDRAKLKTLRVTMRNLRKKLAQATGAEDYIETMGRLGYRLRDLVE